VEGGRGGVGIRINLKNVGPPFFKFISAYIKIAFTQLHGKSLSVIVAVILQIKTIALPI